MKKITIFSVLLLLAIVSFSQKITRGPDVGEIYFLGPTHTGTGLYYSTDFGETAVCVDSIKDLHSIEADKLQGCIYGLEISPNLYFSNNYGNAGSWVYKTSGMFPELSSGETEGYVFNNIESHSEDYGNSFISHNLNGFFGNLKASEIDNQIGTAYAVIKSSFIPDSIFFFITYDNFENLILKKAYHKDDNIFHLIRRGVNFGELFSIKHKSNSFDPYEVYHSENFGDDFSLMNELNITNYYSYGVEGGREDGELFLLYSFVNLMWQNAHIYIYHSIDYGQTFDVYHPFAKGNEPVLSNFSTLTKEVFLMDEIEFDNYSIGDIIEYQWDFDNDGVVDSYEEFPVYTYQDTGYYSVALTVVGQDSSNTFIRESYIHVIDTSTNIISNIEELSNVLLYPNPFSDDLIIKIRNNHQNYVEIYNNTGELIKKISSVNKIITWNGKNNIDQECPSGIYYLKVNNSIHKVVLTK